MNIRILYFLLFICNSAFAQTIVKVNNRDINIDTLSCVHYKNRAYYNDILGVNKLSSDNEHNEIRVTRYFDNRNPLSILILREEKDVWHGFIISIRERACDSLDFVKIVPIPFKFTEPKSGWTTLANKIKKLGIFDINQSEILKPGSGISSDADVIDIEFVRNGTYKRLYIPEPKRNQTVAKKKSLALMRLIGNEFNIDNFFNPK